MGGAKRTRMELSYRNRSKEYRNLGRLLDVAVNMVWSTVTNAGMLGQPSRVVTTVEWTRLS